MTASRGIVRAERVMALVEALTGDACARCAEPLLGQEVVLSMFLGFQDEPCCGVCLSALHGREREEFLRAASHKIGRLPCYRAGWELADEELLAAGPWPAELLPADCRLLGAGARGNGPEGKTQREEPADTREAVASFDAGGLARGELVLELRRLLDPLQPGALLHIVANDDNAGEDLAAWCRLAGHRLLEALHPVYWIERGNDSPRKTQQ